MPLALLLLAACGPRAPQDAVSLEWDAGDRFWLGVRYRRATQMSDEPGMDFGEAPADPADGAWSDEVVWTVDVLEDRLRPDDDSALAPFAATSRGDVRLAVLRAWIDPTLNHDRALLDQDPDIYLVFQEDRDRLAALVSFTDDGVVRSWTGGDLGRSWGWLSQSMLTPMPTLLAPWGTRFRDATMTLEDGSTLVTRRHGDDGVEVEYAETLGGGRVLARYEPDQPWPVETESGHVRVRLLTDVTGGGDAPAERAYAGAIAGATDLDAAVVIESGAFADGGLTRVIGEHEAPWAGPWWPQAEGALVFGAEGRPSLSDRVRDDAMAAAAEVDARRADLDALADGPDRDAALVAWQDARLALSDLLTTFYDGLLADLQARRLVVGGGVVTHGDGWSVRVDDLSPMDQLALIQGVRGEVATNPFYLPAWELLNHLHPGAPGWWGHGDGLAAASILVDEPTAPHEVLQGNTAYEFSVEALQGLLAETHTETFGPVFGARATADGAGADDFGPGTWHRVLSLTVLGEATPLVVDLDAGPAVEPRAITAVNVALSETTTSEDRHALVNLNTASLATIAAVPGLDERLAEDIVAARELWGPFQDVDELLDVPGMDEELYGEAHEHVTVDLAERVFEATAHVTFAAAPGPDGLPQPPPFALWRYTLRTDEGGQPLGGTWDRADHRPDFAWAPVANPAADGRGTENPYLSYGGLVSIVGADLGGR